MSSSQIQAQSAAKAENRLDGIGRSVHEIHTYLMMTQENRPRMLGYTWESDDISTHIRFEDALGRKLILPVVLCHSPKSFLDTLKIMFTDHPGYTKVQLGQFEIHNAVSGQSLLPRSSSILDPGILKEFEIENCRTLWRRSVVPGASLEMNIIKRRRFDAPENQLLPSVPREVPCPSCGFMISGLGFQKWYVRFLTIRNTTT